MEQLDRRVGDRSGSHTPWGVLDLLHGRLSSRLSPAIWGSGEERREADEPPADPHFPGVAAESGRPRHELTVLPVSPTATRPCSPPRRASIAFVLAPSHEERGAGKRSDTVAVTVPRRPPYTTEFCVRRSRFPLAYDPPGMPDALLRPPVRLHQTSSGGEHVLVLAGELERPASVEHLGDPSALCRGPHHVPAAGPPRAHVHDCAGTGLSGRSRPLPEPALLFLGGFRTRTGARLFERCGLTDRLASAATSALAGRHR